MNFSSNESTLLIRFLSVARQLYNFLLPAARTSRFGVEGKSIAIIDISSSSKMEHISTTGRGGASTTVAITIHPIRVGEGNEVGKRKWIWQCWNPIVLSSSSLYWGLTNKQTKEEILQHCVVCVKRKHGTEGSSKCNIHHANTTKSLSHTFGAAKHFSPNESEGESESTKYVDIQYEYVGNLAKIKLLEDRIMTYNMRDPFIIPTLVDEYAGAVDDCWGNRT